jgi:hypothetical protein
MNILETNFGEPLYYIYARGAVSNKIWFPYGSEKYTTLKQARSAFEKIKKEIEEDYKKGLNPWPIEWYKIVKVQHEFVDGPPEY